MRPLIASLLAAALVSTALTLPAVAEDQAPAATQPIPAATPPAASPAPDASPPAAPAAATPPPAATPPAAPAADAAPKRHHALSLVGDPKYGPDFDHFDWVNPDAPKGGTLHGFVEGSFDNLNAFTMRGVPAQNTGLMYDSLLASSPDEPSTEYGQIAEWVSYPPDYSSVTFGLRPEARFHDGKPITPEDVIFVFGALKKAHPQYAFYYKNVVKAEKTGEHEVTFTFDSKGNRELPHDRRPADGAAQGLLGRQRAPTASRATSPRRRWNSPLGSGPYKIKEFDAGRSITYERVKDYWAKDLPVSKGQRNFDDIKLTYFLDRTPAFEEFKSGKLDYWRENVASQWATAYDFAAVKNGWVKKEAIPIKRVPTPMQAFVFNLRRKQFEDPRVRHAFNLAYQFRGSKQAALLRSLSPHRELLRQFRSRSNGPAAGPRARDPERGQGRGAAGGVHDRMEEPGQRHPAEFRNHMREASDLLDRPAGSCRKPLSTKIKDKCGFFCSIMRTDRLLLGADGERASQRPAATC